MRPGVRVILSSGYNEQDVTQRFVGKGLAGFIQKPCHREIVSRQGGDSFASPFHGTNSFGGDFLAGHQRTIAAYVRFDKWKLGHHALCKNAVSELVAECARPRCTLHAFWTGPTL